MHAKCDATGLLFYSHRYIIDIFFDEPIADAPKAAAELKSTCGVFEHGLFCGMTTTVIIAGKDGISQKP